MRRALASGALSTLLTLAAAGHAQEEPGAADMATARAFGQEGVKLADAGNCPEAIEKLARAEKIFHAPTTLGRLGECQVQVGKLVVGTENLHKVAREVLAPTAPAAFTAAQERARKVLAEARPRIAKLKITVNGAPEGQLTVKVDGEAIAVATLNTDRPADPGDHAVEASAPGFKAAAAKVRLAEAGAEAVVLTLEPDGSAAAAPAPAPAPAPAAAPATSPAEARPSSPVSKPSSSAPIVAAYGVGVVGIGLGSVFGLMASSNKDELEAECPGRVCAESSRDTLDSGKTFGTVSTIGFVVGAVGVVAGTYFLISHLTSKSPSASASAYLDGRGTLHF